MSYGEGKKSIGDESLVLRSQTRLLSMGRTGKKHEFVLRIQNYAIEQIEVAMNNSKRKVICIKI
jgi:hypothetical protein